MKTVKEIITEGPKVDFLFYRKGELHYITSGGFQFVVPTSDCGDGTFSAVDKSIYFMRYISKQLQANEQGQSS